MLILRINKMIARHGKLAMVLIAAAIVIPFVFMWGPHSVFDTPAGQRGIRDAGRMYGESIDPEELFQQLSFAQLEKFKQAGEMTPVPGEQLLDQALERMRFLREAEDRKLDRVSEDQIDQTISMMFRDREGGFNRQYYQMFSRNILPHLGMDEVDYREYVRQRIIIQRLFRDITGGVYVSPREVDQQLIHNHENFIALYRNFSVQDFEEQARVNLVSDSEVREYFDANRGAELPSGRVITDLDDETTAEIRELLLREVGEDFYERKIHFLKTYVEEADNLNGALAAYQNDYRSAAEPDEDAFPFSPEQAEEIVDDYIRQVYEPERKKFSIAIFRPENYLDQVEVDKRDLESAYERRSDEFQKRIRARHIMLRAEDNEDEAEEKAPEKLRELRDRIMDGESFAELATEYSQDPGSAARGGDLGTFTREQMVAPFAEAAFALEEGEMSEIVETQFGYHLIKVDEIIPRRELEEVEEELRREIMQREARRLAWTAADDFSYQLFEATAEVETPEKVSIFDKLAEQEEVETVETEHFNMRSPPPLLQDHEEAAETVYNLSSEQPISEVVELNGQSLVALYQSSRPPAIPSFENNERIQRLTTDWAIQEEASRLARAEAEEVYEEVAGELPEADNPQALLQKFNFVETGRFSRAEPPEGNPALQHLLQQRLDAQSVGALSEPLSKNGDSLLVFLAQRMEPEEEIVENQRQMTRQQVYQRKAQWAFERFNEKSEERAQIEIPEELLAHLGRRR